MKIVCHVKVHLWKVVVDGASSALGAKARIVIITPEGIRLEHSFRLGLGLPTTKLSMKPYLPN